MPHDAQNDLTSLLEAAASAPLTDRAFLRITGPDAARWLNGMVTNAIQTLAPGEGCYNFLLNAQGRIQGDCTIYREPGEPPNFLLETDASQLETIRQTLDRFIIMDDVELAPMEHLSGILVAGPRALSIVMALGTANHQAVPCSPAAQPPSPQTLNLTQTAYGGAPVWLIQAYSRLVPRFEIWSDPYTIASILAELHQTDAQSASADALEALRILEASPKYGQDIRNSETHKDLPQETAQDRALHFAKGCYLGQEIVERIRSRGQVHRQFMAFRLTGDLPATLPAPLEANGKPAGELTSAALINLPEGPTLLALGYARREALDTNQPLTYTDGTATPQPKTKN
jgi:folate-binding protein YgfZ